MKGCLISLAVIIGGLFLIVFMLNQKAENPVSASQPDTVIVQAANGNNVVQMFDSMGGNARIIKQLSNGTRCTKVSGPTPVVVEGIPMSFYKLSCGSVAGYVNAQWVR